MVDLSIVMLNYQRVAGFFYHGKFHWIMVVSWEWGFSGTLMGYPLVMTNTSPWLSHGPWIDGLPSNSMMMFHGELLNKQMLAVIMNNWLGGAITILKNMSSSMGRMTSHILWKIKNV